MLTEKRKLEIQEELARKVEAGEYSYDEIAEINERLSVIETQNLSEQQNQNLSKQQNIEDESNKLALKYEGTNLDQFENGVLCPRILYHNHRDKFDSISMYTALFVLLRYRNSSGMVGGLTTREMAEYYNYKSDRRIREGLHKLEKAGIIEIDKSRRPYIYQINDYDFDKGGFAIPEEVMMKVPKGQFTLKDLRLEWYYMCLSHHSLTNNSKLDIRLETLKEIVNANSYQEVIRLAKGVKDRFFAAVDVVSDKIYKGLNKLKVTFNDSALGRISVDQIRKLVENNHYKNVTYILDNLGIELSLSNIKKAIKLAENAAEVDILALRHNCTRSEYTAEYNSSIGYFKKLLELAADNVLTVLE